jgi:hypothetical protein
MLVLSEERWMDSHQQITRAQIGRYLAMTALFRAVIDLLAESTNKMTSEIRSEIKAKIDHSTAALRLSAAGKPEWQAGIAEMDVAIKAILKPDQDENSAFS